MRLLIIGSNGQLGWELCRQGRRQAWDIQGVDLPDFDITNETQVIEQVETVGPQFIVNASAFTAVDKAESEPELAYEVNANGPRKLARVCAIHDIPLIHISTDYVFAGDKKTPYKETDVMAPIGIYGKSKAAGEKAVREELHSHIIIRTAWLYGFYGSNFVKIMLKVGKDHETISVVADQYGCPTYAADLAGAILKIIDQSEATKEKKWGTYHYCGKGETTWHGFAEAIFYIARDKTALKVKKVLPIPTDAYPTPAKRPTNSVLDCNRIQSAYNIQIPPWKDSLIEMLTLLFASENN